MRNLFLASSAAVDVDDDILDALGSIGMVRISNDRLTEGSRDLDLSLEIDLDLALNRGVCSTLAHSTASNSRCSSLVNNSRFDSR